MARGSATSKASFFHRRWLWLVVLCCAALGACNTSRSPFLTTDVSDGLPPLQFTLTDHDGRTVHAADYTDRITLLFFGYLHCPDVCPLTLSRLSHVLDTLGADAGKLRVLFVSVDPQRDTTAALATYVRAFGPQFVGLTGTVTQLRDITRRYHTKFDYAALDAQGDYTVIHGRAIYVFDRGGRSRLLMVYDQGAKAMQHDLALLAQGR